jgi:hypothetical protein
VNAKNVLKEIHLFFADHPPEYWREVPNATPHKTVKALLYEMVCVHGHSTLEMLSLVPLHPTPVIVSYIHLMLKDVTPSTSPVVATLSSSTTSSFSSSVKNPPSPSPSLAAVTPTAHVASSSPPSEMTPELIAILKKAGNKETTAAGIRELYQYKCDHSITDVTPFLSKLSENFRNYIMKSLSAIEAKEKEKEKEALCHEVAAKRQAEGPIEAKVPSSSSKENQAPSAAAPAVSSPLSYSESRRYLSDALQKYENQDSLTGKSVAELQVIFTDLKAEMERVRMIEKHFKESEPPIDSASVANLSLASFCKPSPFTLEELVSQYASLKQGKM